MRSGSKATLAILGLLAATPLAGQQLERTQTISFSPVLAMFEILVADYEQALGAETTLGTGLGWWQFDEDDAATDGTHLGLDLNARFYPDRAFQGFEFGASVGLARVGFHEDQTGEGNTAIGFTYGIEVGHAWLLGDQRRWFLGTAIGARRYWFGEEDPGLPEVMPTGRLIFGIAF